MNNEMNIIGLRHGLLAGIAGMVSSAALIAMSREAFLGLGQILSLAITFYILIKYGRKARNEHFDGHLSYVAALVYSSIVIFISYLFEEISRITICTYVDSEIPKYAVKEGLQAAETLMRQIGKSESEIDKTLDQMEFELHRQFSYYYILSNGTATLVISIILGGIGALLIKKSKPDFEEINE